MKSPSEGLLELLEEIYRLYGSLEELLKEEKLALLKNSLDEIVEYGKRKESITLTLSRLEENREKLVSVISRENNRKKGEIDLTFLSRNPDPFIAARFSKMKSSLTPLLSRVGQLNRENKSFIEESMNGVASTFGFFCRITTDKKTYRGSGKYESQKSGTTGKVFCQQI